MPSAGSIDARGCETMTLPHVMLDPLILMALHEDLGDRGDITSDATIPADLRIKAVIRARCAGIVAGLQPAMRSFQLLGGDVVLTPMLQDGAAVMPNQTIITFEGHARSILMGERVALNFMGHLSGIATATYAMTRAIAHTHTKIVDTRKTTPGMRALEKQAVRLGGGVNHRFGLYDAILIKDNHIAAIGGVRQALEKAKSSAGHMVKIEIEVDNLSQLQEVCDTGLADCVLLDNMGPDLLTQAVQMVAGKMTTEASGNITLSTITQIAQTGVDYISSGWLTHSAPNLDLGLDIL